MRFIKFKDSYGDLVHGVEDLFMHGSQVSLDNISSINLKNTNYYNTRSGVSNIDKHTTYYLSNRGGNHRFYGYNPHYGWNKLSPEI